MIPEGIRPRPHRRASKTERRLVAVLGADIQGYSALIGRAEERIHQQVVAQLERVCRAAERSHGRVFSQAGDGVMAEFPSAVEALRCAMRIQESSARRNARLPLGDGIMFRIGLNTGEIVVQGDRIGGTTVNVAARLEALAEPGGISLSAAVFEQVRRAIVAPYEPIGQKQLKNIRDAVLVYAIPASTFSAGAAAQVSLYPADGVTAAQRFGEAPAIAVLPLRCQVADDEPFVDALTEELINALSRWRRFPVIARNSVFAFRGRDLDVRVIGAELGAQYIVSGSVRRHNEQARVTLDLVDVESGKNLLSERYERTSADPFALQDELVRAIAGVLVPEVLKLELERAVERPANAPGLYGLYARALWHRRRLTREDLATAESLLRQVLEVDAHYARASAALAMCLNFKAISRWAPDVQATHTESLTLARRALRDDPLNPHAHFAVGVACMNVKRIREAMTELREATRLNPSHAAAHANLGQVLNYFDQPDEGLSEVELALRLNPYDPARFMWLPYVAASHYLAGRYWECLEACDQARVANPDYPHAVRYMLAALGQLNRQTEASQLLPLIRQFDENLAGAEKLCRSLFVPRAADRIVEGWRLAGFA
jgi:TolB-like protein/class 3 adenylate cyclase/Tfp pilus assembly protein PilF